MESASQSKRWHHLHSCLNSCARLHDNNSRIYESFSSSPFAFDFPANCPSSARRKIKGPRRQPDASSSRTVALNLIMSES